MQESGLFYNFLKNNAERYGSKTAILYDTFAVSFADLFTNSVKKALHLQRFEGKRIAVYGPASYRWIVNVFGSILAGKDVLLLDFFLPHDIRDKILENAETDYVLCSTNQYILSDRNAIVIPNAEKDCVDGMEYDTATKEGKLIVLTAVNECCDKPVVLLMKNILTAVSCVQKICACDETDKVLCQIPLNHIFGLLYGLLWPLGSGACVCVGRGLRHMDSDTFYYHPTLLPGNPAMIGYLQKINAFNPELKRIIVSDSACSANVMEAVREKGLSGYCIYGSAETAACVGADCNGSGAFAAMEEGTIHIAPDGEILVGGGCIMQGYDKDEETTQRVLADGLFHTGDYGYMDADGKLVITKYNDAVINIPTGEKLSRRKIIQELNALNGVAESYIELYRDKLTAVIVPLDRSKDENWFKRLIDRYNEKKGYRWKIQQIKVTDKALEKQENGSPDKEALRKLLEEEYAGKQSV